MASSDFLPIAISGTAPVLSQSDWAAATPANGRGAGILPKEYFNKALRQSSVMAAAIAQFMVAQGQNALDDGNVPELAAAFAAALLGGAAPTFFSLRIGNSYTGGGTRSVTLVPGTYTVSLHSIYLMDESAIGGGAYDNTVTQSGIVALGGNTATVNTAARVFRGGSSGYGRFINFEDFKLASLTVPTAGSYAMTLTAASQSGGVNTKISGVASILTCERVG